MRGILPQATCICTAPPVHVEDEYYQKATEFQETSLRTVISVTCVIIFPLPVTPAQLMKPGIGRNTFCTLGDFHCDIWLFAAKGVHD